MDNQHLLSPFMACIHDQLDEGMNISTDDEHVVHSWQSPDDLETYLRCLLKKDLTAPVLRVPIC